MFERQRARRSVVVSRGCSERVERLRSTNSEDSPKRWTGESKNSGSPVQQLENQSTRSAALFFFFPAT